MDKKFIMVLVVVAGVLLGIFIASKQKDPLKEMLKQQTEMLKIQARMENKLLVPGSGSNTNLPGDFSKLQELEGRITALENLVKRLEAGDPQQAQRQGPPPEDYTKVYDIPVDHSPVRGNTKAPVTIVAFNDYQCPFSARFHPVMLEVLKAYPDKVNFIIKNFPLSFHPQAIPGAKAVMAAGEQGKYFEMADALLADNKDLSDERFKKEAEKLGLNVEKFMKDYNDAKWQDMIQKDLTLGQTVTVQGTPTFYINGHKSQARDLDSWKKEIDQILKK